MMQEVLPAPALDALDSLAREAALEIGGVACLVSLLDGGRPFLRSEVGLPLSMVAGQETPLLDSLCLLVAGHRGTLIIEDAQRHGEARAGRTLRRLGIRSCVGFPLTPEDTVLGSFCVICDRQRCWESEEVDLVRRLAAIAAVEVGTRMRDVPRDELEMELEPLRAKVNRSFLDNTGLEEAVGGALEAVCRGLAWDIAGAWIADPESDELRCAGQWHRPSLGLQSFADVCQGLRFASDEDMVGTTWAMLEPIWSPELPPPDEFPRAAIAAGAGLSCAAWVPLLAGFQPLGALEFLAREAGPLHARTVPDLGDFGRQIAELIALRRDEEGVPSSWLAPELTVRRQGPFTGLPQPGDW